MIKKIKDKIFEKLYDMEVSEMSMEELKDYAGLLNFCANIQDKNFLESFDELQKKCKNLLQFM